MNDLNISSCVVEISDCMTVHCAFFEEELRRGTTPDRYGILTILDQAVEKALQIIKKVPEFMRMNKKYADELRNKFGTFRSVTNTKKSVFLTFVSSSGLAQNAHSGIIQCEIELKDLFAM